MPEPHASAVIVASLTTAIVSTTSIPAVRSIWTRYGSRKGGYSPVPSGETYEDQDGKAKRESQAEFSQFWPRAIGSISTTIGLGAAIASAVLFTVQSGNEDLVSAEAWLRTAIWAVIEIQAASLWIETQYTRRYNLGVWAALGCFLTTIITVINTSVFETVGSGGWTQESKTLVGIQIAASIISLLAFTSIPRRPEVWDDSDGVRRVDGENTATFLGLLSYSWARGLLGEAKRRKKLDYEDLPQLENRIRSKTLAENFYKQKRFSRLWITILYQYRRAFGLQIFWSTMTDICEFLPQVSLLMLLRALESRDGGPSVDAWLWVGALGVSYILIGLIEQRLFFTIWSQLGIPMTDMFAALIFQKALNRNDVKGGKKDKGEEGVKVNLQTGPVGEDTIVEPEGEKKEDEEEVDQDTRQGTINLIGVDGERISRFCTYFYFYTGSIIKVTGSLTFLLFVVGWRPLLAGIFAFSLTIPMNIYFARRYGVLQEQLMNTRDKKLAVVTEALQGIRQIKFSALENQWQTKVMEIRNSELSTIWKTFICDLVIIMCYISCPVLLSGACLSTYAIIYGELRPSVAFTTLSILASLEVALTILPELTTEAIDAWISINRIEKYLDAVEKVEPREPADRIIFDHADVAWPTDNLEEDQDRFILRDINIAIPPNELTVISGKTGSGKTLLLSAILGEVDKVAGSIHAPVPPPLNERFDSKATKGNWIIDSAIAYVAQVPWIENATVKDNILFGLPYDSGRYNKTLQVCALVKDLEMLDDGDDTEIGHNGVNLSGGQRWRVGFARAMYSRAGILVLDDIFSAVDAHVGRQLFEEALTGELATGRTRILVTHHVSLVLPKTTYSIHLANGTISHAGLVEELEQSGHLQQVLKETKNDDPDASSAATSDAGSETNVADAYGHDLTKTMSRRSQRSALVDDGGIDIKAKMQPKKFVEDEKREEGAIKWLVYKLYLTNAGSIYFAWVPLLVLFALIAITDTAGNAWIANWSSGYESRVKDSIHMRPQQMMALQTPMQLPNTNFTSWFQTTDTQSKSTTFYLSIYLSINVLFLSLSVFRLWVSITLSIRASKKLFDKLLYTVLRAPLRWLDTVPVGRVLNRFTGDFNTIDSSLTSHLSYFSYQAYHAVTITIVSCVVSPIMIPLAAVLSSLAAYISMLYLHGSRPVKRLENNAKSPIYELFGTVLVGMPTVRAFSKSPEYIERMWRRIDQHGRSLWHLWLLNRWMGFRLAMLASIFVICVSIFIVWARTPASLAGFVLSFALSYAESITWVLRSYANLELDMTAVERVSEYMSLDTEPEGGAEPPAAWPTKGAVEVKGLVVSYAPDLPPVLKGLTFSISPAQRVGVVGRTGAGKSSLTLALFRFLEPSAGKVVIDGVDTSTISLYSLRSRLAIIPQDPVLFSGTVRSNLDPFDKFSDAELKDALERVHLVEPSLSSSASSSHHEAGTGTGSATPTHPEQEPEQNKNPFRSLTSPVSEGGLNLSQGQRQLLCLARAIVARPRLMMLDEATSAVDKDTDELIQRSIRAEFTGSTLLVIAHRLSTIADFDKILVLGEGKVLEFGSPKELLGREDGVFRGMVKESGERGRLEDVILGRGGE